MSTCWIPFAAFAAALSLVLIGCKRPTPPSVGSAAPKIVETGPPVSEKEAEEFGQKVVAAFTAKDANALVELIGMEDMCLRSVSDFNMTVSERKSFADGFREGGGGQEICQAWISRLKGMRAKCLHTREKDGRWAVVIRFLGDVIGVNYFELTIARGAGGRVTVEDIYMYMAGETFTQVLRRRMIAALPARGGGDGQNLALLTRQTELQRLRVCVQSGETAEGRRIYFALPLALRDEKYVQLMGMQTLQDDEKAYLVEMERYRKLHPKDPSLDLVLVD